MDRSYRSIVNEEEIMTSYAKIISKYLRDEEPSERTVEISDSLISYSLYHGDDELTTVLKKIVTDELVITDPEELNEPKRVWFLMCWEAMLADLLSTQSVDEDIIEDICEWARKFDSMEAKEVKAMIAWSKKFPITVSDMNDEQKKEYDELRAWSDSIC